jgi:hypothetical protein
VQDLGIVWVSGSHASPQDSKFSCRVTGCEKENLTPRSERGKLHLRKGQQNMKNFFFGISALALLLVGCDDGTFDPNDATSGKPDATSGSQSDVIPSGPISCPIPKPASPVGPGMSSVSSVPTLGYRLLTDPEHFTCSTYPDSVGPTNCSSPVDGFAKTLSDPWCCVDTFANTVGGGPKIVSATMLSPSLRCATNGIFDRSSEYAGNIPGKVALCSSDGKFMGWDCNAMTNLPTM